MTTSAKIARQTIDDIDEKYPGTSEQEKLILLQLSSEKSIKVQDILEEVTLSIRTVRYSLKKLQEKGLIETFPDFNDLRSQFYRLKA
ncbi:MAG: winged helix-turn-helix domain-containing protein [Candidatus Odinarchaeota archaeon]